MRGSPAGNQAQFKLRDQDGIPIVEVIGEVDLSNVEAFAAALASAARADRRGIAVILDGATYFDTQGIHILFRVNERLTTHRQQLHLALAEGHRLRRILQVAGLFSLIPVSASVDEAIAKIHLSGTQQDLGSGLLPREGGVRRPEDENS